MAHLHLGKVQLLRQQHQLFCLLRQADALIAGLHDLEGGAVKYGEGDSPPHPCTMIQEVGGQGHRSAGVSQGLTSPTALWASPMESASSEAPGANFRMF